MQDSVIGFNEAGRNVIKSRKVILSLTKEIKRLLQKR